MKGYPLESNAFLSYNAQNCHQWESAEARELLVAGVPCILTGVPQAKKLRRVCRTFSED